MLLLRTIAIVLPLLLLKRITITPKILLILMQTATAGGSSVNAGVFFGCSCFSLVMVNVMLLMSLFFFVYCGCVVFHLPLSVLHSFGCCQYVSRVGRLAVVAWATVFLSVVTLMLLPLLLRLL